jgi:hypothetical protein
MTVSRDDRLENRALALELLLKFAGDQAVWCMDFLDPDEVPELKAVYPTTWKELDESGYVKRFGGLNYTLYQLTPLGWLRGLQITGQDQSPEFKERLGRLAAVLKISVKGRHEEAWVDLETVAKEANLPVGWVSNAVEAGAIEECFNRQGAHLDDSQTVAIVPIDFGLEML